jgi:hypothetical protein
VLTIGIDDKWWKEDPLWALPFFIGSQHVSIPVLKTLRPLQPSDVFVEARLNRPRTDLVPALGMMEHLLKSKPALLRRPLAELGAALSVCFRGERGPDFQRFDDSQIPSRSLRGTNFGIKRLVVSILSLAIVIESRLSERQAKTLTRQQRRDVE